MYICKLTHAHMKKNHKTKLKYCHFPETTVKERNLENKCHRVGMQGTDSRTLCRYQHPHSDLLYEYYFHVAYKLLTKCTYLITAYNTVQVITMPLQHIQNNDKTKLVHDLHQCNFPPDIFSVCG